MSGTGLNEEGERRDRSSLCVRQGKNPNTDNIASISPKMATNVGSMFQYWKRFDLRRLQVGARGAAFGVVGCTGSGGPGCWGAGGVGGGRLLD